MTSDNVKRMCVELPQYPEATIVYNETKRDDPKEGICCTCTMAVLGLFLWPLSFINLCLNGNRWRHKAHRCPLVFSALVTFVCLVLASFYVYLKLESIDGATMMLVPDEGYYADAGNPLPGIGEADNRRDDEPFEKAIRVSSSTDFVPDNFFSFSPSIPLQLHEFFKPSFNLPPLLSMMFDSSPHKKGKSDDKSSSDFCYNIAGNCPEKCSKLKNKGCIFFKFKSSDDGKKKGKCIHSSSQKSEEKKKPVPVPASNMKLRAKKARRIQLSQRRRKNLLVRTWALLRG